MPRELIKKLYEDVGNFNFDTILRTNLLREGQDNLPDSLHVTLRVLTANKITKNKTFYPLDSLRGRPSKGTGLQSYVHPYPVPVLANHDKYGEVYGRVYHKPQIARTSDTKTGVISYVEAMATITNPKAIEELMSGRWYTVSNGASAQSVTCSICKTDLTLEYCEHIRGKYYKVEDEDKPVMAYLIIGPLVNEEISFVTVPSDNEAGVIKIKPATAQAESYSPIISAAAQYKDRVVNILSESAAIPGNINYTPADIPRTVGAFKFS